MFRPYLYVEEVLILSPSLYNLLNKFQFVSHSFPVLNLDPSDYVRVRGGRWTFSGQETRKFLPSDHHRSTRKRGKGVDLKSEVCNVEGTGSDSGIDEGLRSSRGLQS